MRRYRLKGLFCLTALPLGHLYAQTLDTTSFVVMGEGLAAGMANFGLSSVVQNSSFPAQMAAQMGTAFTQPLFEPPGIGDVIGYPGQVVNLHAYPQGSVRVLYQPDPTVPAAPPAVVQNLSIPGFTLADSVTLKPVEPIAQHSMKQTMVNLILGFPQLFTDNAPLQTQLEYAESLNPTLAIVELGFYEAISAAVTGHELPEPEDFGATYARVLAGLKAKHAQVIAATIPNPVDTAYFSSPDVASTIVAAQPGLLTSLYHLQTGDYVTRNGLVEISNQFSNRTVSHLSAGSVFSAANAAEIGAWVSSANSAIRRAAQASGAVVYDLNAFSHRIKTSGATAGTITLTADYLGGFYSLDGVYPGATGQALIANDILALLNSTYHSAFPLISVPAVAATDPTVQYRKPSGAVYTAAMLNVSTSGADYKEEGQ
jgi:hypothetical protein